MESPGTDLAHMFNVLLVDDDTCCSLTVATLLTKIGHYRVSRASNVGDALQLLDAAQGTENRYDLILTDLVMPEVTGFDLMLECSKRGHHIPVVVMSSHDSQDSVMRAFECGAADFLIKPIRRNEAATLWQHVWRANRPKGEEVSATPTPPLRTEEVTTGAGVSNSPLDSGDPTSLDSADNKNGSSGVSTSLAEHDQDSGNRKHARESAGDSSDISIKQAHTQAMDSPGHCEPAVAAVHVDLQAAAALFNSRRLKMQGKDGRGSSMDGSSDPSRQSSGSHLPSSPAVNKLPLFRPHALCSANSDASGSLGSLPPGLRELAELGTARQQQQQQYVVRHTPQDPKCSAVKYKDKARTSGSNALVDTLNHSDRSAFTAVTVFLPRILGDQAAGDMAPYSSKPASWLPPLPGVLLSLQKTACKQPEPCPTDIKLEQAPPLNLHLEEMAGTSGLSASGKELSAIMGQSFTLAPGHLQPAPAIHLPDSVAHFIRALSTRPGDSWWPNSAPAQPNSSSPITLPVIQSLAFGSETTANSGSGLVASSGKPHSVYRAEAVAKYLEKRKHRVFHKKVRYESRKRLAEASPRVRYESRKRLAEARPRVRGQFVKYVAAPAEEKGRAAETADSGADRSGCDSSGNRSGPYEGERDAAGALAALGTVDSGGCSN
eukprot:gene23299-30536_t